MTIYEVGKPYTTRKRWEERSEYNWRGEHELRMFFNRLSPHDIKMIREGPVEFALYIENDILLFMFKFDGVIAWSDAPYSIHLVTPEERIDPVINTSTRDLLNIILVSAEDGIIRALRVVSFSPDFTRILRQAIHDQLERDWPDDYDHQLNTIYHKYPSSEMLVHHATSRCKGGD